MAGILRGEIRWADLNPTRGHEQAGLRPVLILSHDIFEEIAIKHEIARIYTDDPYFGSRPITEF